jgi:hypothetical protein
LGGGAQWRAHDTAPVDAANAPAREQPGPLEHYQMPGDRGQRDAVRRSQRAHRRLTTRQARQDRPACGVGQGGKCAIQGWAIVNHMVNY